MKNIKTLIEETQKDIEDTTARLAEYCEGSTYITDAINEIADGAAPIYYSDIVQWFKETPGSKDYVNDAVNEFGFRPGEFDIFKAIQWGACEYYRNQISEELEDGLKLAAFVYIQDVLKLEEITDEQAEEIEEIDFNRLDTFTDLQNEIQTIFDL